MAPPLARAPSAARGPPGRPARRAGAPTAGPAARPWPQTAGASAQRRPLRQCSRSRASCLAAVTTCECRCRFLLRKAAPPACASSDRVSVCVRCVLLQQACSCCTISTPHLMRANGAWFFEFFCSMVNRTRGCCHSAAPAVDNVIWQCSAGVYLPGSASCSACAGATMSHVLWECLAF